MNICELVEQNIALLGFGREAQATAKFLRSHLYQRPIYVLSDESNLSSTEQFGEIIHLRPEQLAKHQINLVIRSPGFSPLHPLRQFLDQQNIKQTTATRLALYLMRQQNITVIGITASKGKSTTSTLTQLMLQQSAISSLLVGNIGVPVIAQLTTILRDKPVVVMELSSYQCADLEEDFAPTIAYIGALFPEHIDYHGSIAAYYQAKFNLALSQRLGDTIFLHQASALQVPLGKAQRIIVNQTNATGFYFRDGNFYQGKQYLFSDHEMLLPGHHNRENACAALALSSFCGAKLQKSLAVINSFAGLPYRLQFEGQWHGISWYNDSISTAPEAAVAALDALAGKAHTLIVGGQDRGYDVSPLIAAINRLATAQVLVLPETGGKIAESLLASGYRGALTSCCDLSSAVKKAKKTMPVDSICLFSPGAPSYHAFSDFIQRGEVFRAALREP